MEMGSEKLKHAHLAPAGCGQPKLRREQVHPGSGWRGIHCWWQEELGGLEWRLRGVERWNLGYLLWYRTSSAWRDWEDWEDWED